MKNKIFLLSLFLITLLQMKGQKFQEPQWSMNFYFEDATGARDTLTIGYDPIANMTVEIIDPQFNEGWIWIDTSIFNVYILKYGTGGEMYPVYPPIDTDSVRKRSIASWPYPEIEFGWVHGMLPVTVKWDAEKLDSPDLPSYFIDLDLYPRARVDLWYQPSGYFSEPECATIVADPPPPTTILTNCEEHPWPLASCIMVDSLVWNSDPPEEPGYSILPPELLVVPFNDLYWYIIDVDNIDHIIRIFPNPVKDYLIIQNHTGSCLKYHITNIVGQVLYTGETSKEEEILDLSGFTKGIYFLNINKEIIKIIKR